MTEILATRKLSDVSRETGPSISLACAFPPPHRYEMKLLVNGVNVLSLAPGIFYLTVVPKRIDTSSGINYPFRHTQVYKQVKRGAEKLIEFVAADEYGNDAK